eukprot:TRINITY_DN43412_c0_g1_i6.p1 TRINITY_DN43412_c0_g1~~TRINITY_DN43412_c0_g1_i6.p1  ORF type:complete len:148 (+),score=11.34 TRINITY_DN43412_c0_g1_i6:410-853(+)
MHYPYKPNAKAYASYYCTQAGHGLPVFVGGRHQRGRGLGSLLSGSGRSLIPLLKSGGKALLKQGAQTGMQVAQDVLSGQNIKTALNQRSKQAGKRLLNQAVRRVVGAPPGEPASKRIKSSASHRIGQKKRSKVKRKKTRKASRDIFG